MAVTIAQICDAIAASLVPTPGIERVQSYDELTEGMNTLPTIQVYPESLTTDTAKETDMTTFKRGVRQTGLLFRIDVYVRQRSQLNEDMGEMVTIWDAVQTQLEATSICPNAFGLADIRNVHWTCQRVVFDYATVLYAGFRYEITIRVF